MKKFFLALTVVLAVASSAQCQDDLLGRLRKIEQNNDALAARFASVERKTDLLTDKVDVLTAKVDNLSATQKSAAATRPGYLHPCLCGCPENGICTCKNCNVGTGFELPAAAAPVKKVAAAPAGVWSCGPRGCSFIPATSAIQSQQFAYPQYGTVTYSTRSGLIARFRSSRSCGSGGCR